MSNDCLLTILPDGGKLFAKQHFSAGLEEVFSFFSNPHNLERITPPFLRFSITRAPDTHPWQPAAGSTINCVCTESPFAGAHGSKPGTRPHAFVDVQEHDPYLAWHHHHEFKRTGEGTIVYDRVRYRLPLGRLGSLLAGTLVRHNLSRIFTFRQTTLAAIFANGTSERATR
jgi:ligand-binding SRPBCC domain-containing protein